MNASDKPLRAVLLESFSSSGTQYHKGEVVDIVRLASVAGSPAVLISDGSRTCLVSPSTIQIIAPESKKTVKTVKISKQTKKKSWKKHSTKK